MGTPYWEVVEKLKSFGGMPGAVEGKALPAFNQGSFRTDAGVQDKYDVPGGTEVKSLAGGYCEGVCLDWIRRMLLVETGKKRGEYLRYGSKGDKSATVKRMAYAWAKQKGNYGATESQLKTDLEAAIRKQGQPVKSKTVKGINTKYEHGITLPTELVARLLRTYDLADWGLTGKFPQEILEKSRVEHLIKQLGETAGGDGVAKWKGVAKDLDTEFNRLRDGETKEHTKKPFSSITLTKCEPTKPYVGPEAWMDALFPGNDPTAGAFPTNCGTRLGFGLKLKSGSMSGHAVAVHDMGKNGWVFFFDPNYGVFLYNPKGLKEALEYLFWRKGTIGTSKPVYGEDGSTVTNTMSYDVFQKV